jgi:hypothetical protein
MKSTGSNSNGMAGKDVINELGIKKQLDTKITLVFLDASRIINLFQIYKRYKPDFKLIDCA